jgi:uncharacterized protein YdeI (YjbR/CyaY-like superfamily)
MKINKTEKRPVKMAAKSKPAPRAPADLRAALSRATKARSTWEALGPGPRREYLEWISEAKRSETRLRRVATTVAWLKEGKRRNWKYER